jgi:hypothetical protein
VHMYVLPSMVTDGGQLALTDVSLIASLVSLFHDSLPRGIIELIFYLYCGMDNYYVLHYAITQTIDIRFNISLDV